MSIHCEVDSKVIDDIQEEQERVRQEQAAHMAHLEEVLAHFGQEVQKVEDLQKMPLWWWQLLLQAWPIW